MSIYVEIEDTETGKCRTYEEELGWHGEFIWAEGNLSTDFNRFLMFERAIGLPGDLCNGFDTCGCPRFRIISIRDEGGFMLYGEMSEIEEFVEDLIG